MTKETTHRTAPNTADRSAAERRSKSFNRSKVTNGKKLMLGADGRSAWVRRCRDLIELHLNDLGGADNVSAAERSIIHRASVMTVELEMLEQKFAAAGFGAEPDDLDLYVRASGNLRRLLETIGLERRAKDVTPALKANYPSPMRSEFADEAA